MVAVKVTVVGPCGGGKTSIANHLAGEPLQMATTPTVGCRILERDSVEVWDISGSTDYESCWPAIMKDTNGVILVYNPENEGHVSETATWYEYFVKKNGLSDDQCVVFAFAPNGQPGSRARASPDIQHLNVVNITLNDAHILSQQFDSFLRVVKRKLEEGKQEAK